MERRKEMKTNRYKNPYFWIGLIGVILTAMGISPEKLTSWDMVVAAAVDLIKNPYLLLHSHPDCHMHKLKSDAFHIHSYVL